MKILITGGTGFIGSNFVRYMFSKYSDVEIVNLDSFSYGANSTNLKDIEKRRNYKFIEGSITNQSLIQKVMQDVDAVVNMAAETHVDRSISSPASFIRTNTLGSFNLLEAARKARVETYVHISTDEIYGSAYTGSFKETDILQPTNPYSASKAAADMFVIAYNKTYGLKTIITRCTNNFGPYQFPEKFIPKAIIRTLLELKIPLYGSGKQIRDWVYVADHCEAIDLTLRKGAPGGIYNISSGNEMENIRIVESILGLLGKHTDAIEFVEDRPGHDVRYSLDSTKIRTELKWKPKSNFKEALKETVDWYASNEWWWKPLINEKILHPTPWKLRW